MSNNWLPKGATPYKKNPEKLAKLNKKKKHYSKPSEACQLKLFK